jgi:hypothetical protein
MIVKGGNPERVPDTIERFALYQNVVSGEVVYVNGSEITFRINRSTLEKMLKDNIVDKVFNFPVVIYSNQEQQLWARPEAEWFEVTEGKKRHKRFRLNKDGTQRTE